MRNIERSHISRSFLLLIVGLLTIPNLGRLAAQDPDDLSQPMNALGDVGQQDPGGLQPSALSPNITGELNDPTVSSSANPLVNDNIGSTGTSRFTQSETSTVAFGSTIVVAFNDSGSFTGGASKFTGYSYSTDGGATFTDGGTLPTNPNGDAGDPVLARDEITGRIYFATLQFSGSSINVFHSDDDGVTWSAPVQGAPGKTGMQDKDWIAVDNFPGGGNGNVYLIERDFGPGNGIYFYRSTDLGATFGPSGGTLIASANQGAFVTVAPDHSVYAFWWSPGRISVRKSTDLGVTFGAPVTVATGLVGGVNGDLGLTGLRQGTVSQSVFRTNEFPHAAVNPVTGDLFVTYNNKGAGTDKADVFLVESTDGGTTWTAPFRVNDDSTTTDQWQPTLAVTPDGAAIGLFYYSRQEDSANNSFKYYGRIGSISGGAVTFGPSFAVSDTDSLPEFGRDSVVNSAYMGDYNTAFATAGAFNVSWSDNRDDLAGGAPRKDPNVYFARVEVPPPAILGASATPDVLWPPNHKLVDVAVNYTVSGVGPITTSLSVASNERGSDDNTAPDWVVLDEHHVQLRAERAGDDDTGRIYRITITATGPGGATTQDVFVTVPHDQGTRQ